MDGENSGVRQEAQEQEATQGQQQQETSGQEEVGGNTITDWKAQSAQRDARIAELRQASADARIDFKLQLAGCRNVKAARAVLADHGNDVDKLRAEEPWLFNAGGVNGGGESGTTGLPNAGAAKDTGKQLRHWREVAGLADDDKKKE